MAGALITWIIDFLWLLPIFGVWLLFELRLFTKQTLPISIFLLLFIYHTGFSLLSLDYILHFGGDAIAYFERARIPFEHFGFASDLIPTLILLPKQILGFGFYSLNVIFSLIGLSSLLRLYLFSTKDRQSIDFFFIFIISFLLLPGLHFWTAYMGKEAIVIWCLILFFSGLLNITVSLWKCGFAIFVLFLIRPHIAMLLLVSLISVRSFVFNGYRTIIQLVVLTTVTLILLWFAAPILGIDAFNPAGVIDAFGNRLEASFEGGSSFVIADYSLIERMFFFLFGRFHFDSSLFSLVILFESFYLLVGFFISVHFFYIYRKYIGWEIVTGFVFCVITWVVLSSTIGNDGISIRQKWMIIVPWFMLLVHTCNKAFKRDEENCDHCNTIHHHR